MKYIVTGATGHIGNNLVRLLLENNEQVKVLVRRESDVAINGLDCEKVVGDICNLSFLEEHIEADSIVIHSAGLIDITNKLVEQLMAINFNLTVNLVQICIKKKVNKFIYISSTDAINIKEGKIIEPKTFELEGLDNYYAITKAMASDYVLKTINQGLLDGCIVCPSCVLGINDFKVSSQGGVVKKQINKKFAFSMRAHYNFVDVENVVLGIYNASKIKTKPVYLLTGVDVTVHDLFETMFKVQNKKIRIFTFPLFLVKIGVLFMPLYYKITKKPPVFTKMTIDTIIRNIAFDHSLATQDLNFQDTDFRILIQKTIEWFSNNQ